VCLVVRSNIALYVTRSFLIVAAYYPEDGGRMFFRNVLNYLPDDVITRIGNINTGNRFE
jgi:hypothetical protein